MTTAPSRSDIQFTQHPSLRNRGTQIVAPGASINDLLSSIETEYPIAQMSRIMISDPSQVNNTAIKPSIDTNEFGAVRNSKKDLFASDSGVEPDCTVAIDTGYRDVFANNMTYHYSDPQTLSSYSLQQSVWTALKSIRVVSVNPVVELPKYQLFSALSDLSEAVSEAEEEGYPRPSDIAIKNAEILIRDVYKISPRRYEVYPTPDGEIAIDAPNGRGSSVILLCDSEGGALCLVNMDRKHRRKYYPSIDSLSDGFVYESLMGLGRIAE